MSEVTVEYYCPLPGRGKGNLMWNPAHRMRGGKFPATHPLATNPEPTTIGRPEPTDEPESNDVDETIELPITFPEGVEA